jgi:hypothetical protein
LTAAIEKHARDFWAGMTLLAVAVVSGLCFAIPIYVIRPFRAQGSQELAIALLVRRFGPSIALVCALVAIAVAMRLWPHVAKGRRAAAVAGVVLACGFAALSRVNVYEIMFHPINRPAFLAAGNAPVEKDDMVLAVRVNQMSRAYPIRTMGYHHIVNDRVGGVPIVATY